MPFKLAYDQSRDKSLTEIPSDIALKVTLEDADWAIVNWFKNDQPIQIANHVNDTIRNIPVIWSGAERWFYFTQEIGNEHRNIRTGQIILPIISIHRKSEEPIDSRNVPTDKNGTTEILFAVDLSMMKHGTIPQPYTLSGDTESYDIIAVQPPKWTKVAYSGLVWTQFQQEMNVVIQHLITRMGKLHSVWSPQGFSMFCSLDTIDKQVNFEDLANDERIIKQEFSLVVEVPLIEGVRSARMHKTVGTVRVATEQILSAKDAENIEWRSPYDITGEI